MNKKYIKQTIKVCVCGKEVLKYKNVMWNGQTSEINIRCDPYTVIESSKVFFSIVRWP